MFSCFEMADGLFSIMICRKLVQVKTEEIFTILYYYDYWSRWMVSMA